MRHTTGQRRRLLVLDHEPAPSPREATRASSPRCTEVFFAKYAAHRRQTDKRCTCPKRGLNYWQLIHRTIGYWILLTDAVLNKSCQYKLQYQSFSDYNSLIRTTLQMFTVPFFTVCIRPTLHFISIRTELTQIRSHISTAFQLTSMHTPSLSQHSLENLGKSASLQ